MKKAKDQVRLDVLTGEESSRGRLFVDPSSAAITDLSGIRILRCGVDTVRQLYKGLIRPQVLALFEEPGMVEFAGEWWHAGRVGRDSGYQCKLQNADLGLILLVKNFNEKADVVGSHLKIEVSPHAIDSKSPEQLQAWLDGFAAQVLDQCEVNQCAVHVALDVQGWAPPADLVARLHCRARAQRDHSGIQSVCFDENVATYGRGQSFLFGSASGMQMAIYNKTLQARAIDKLDYWESVWRRSDNPFDDDDVSNYDPEKPVYRIEARFHHSVVRQFADGSVLHRTGECIGTHSFASLAGHLQGLWTYALGSFRLLSRPGMYDPFWTLIRDDVVVSVEADSLLEDTVYKRYYKTARGFSGKNVELFLGNFLSIVARDRIGAQRAFQQLKQWDCWPVIRDHYASKGKEEHQIYKHVAELLRERTVRWGRAV
ncbi:hypothetical protein DK254_27560 [Pseudomonas sp. RW407]|uniref:hypothetical protein n=1 Tax=Pseudomonas sp. RW407 TaxID=2202894 RepID=UPI000D6F7C7C|nr:hypothetical protein [Pseudomonas sp. RW407]PWU26338.1 hypothetical protein DK254_27560 [Pseudomonas sp. RW407]